MIRHWSRPTRVKQKIDTALLLTLMWDLQIKQPGLSLHDLLSTVPAVSERCRLPSVRIIPNAVWTCAKRPFTAALLSVYDKSNLIDLATALTQSGVRLLGSGGTAKKIRDAGLTIEYVHDALTTI